MIVAALTCATSAALRGTPHREAGGVMRRWVRFLRRHPDYYRTLYATYEQQPAGRLAQIHLEPTNGCNIRCVTCHSHVAALPKRLMPLELARRVIDEAWQEMGARGKLGLFIRGESVLHPELPEMVRHARARGFVHILLSTNLVLLTDSRARALLESGMSEMRLSIDAVDAETFEATRAGADFNRIVANLDTLARVRAELGSACRFRLHASLHRRSFERVPQFVRRWSRIVQQFRFTVAVNQGGLFSQDVAQSFSGLRFATSTAYQVPCRILYDYVGVTWDGKLTSCCVDYREQFVTGRFEDGLRAGFDSAAARELRERHRRGDFGELCGRCGFNNALVDWFEDEINDYVADHFDELHVPARDARFHRALEAMIAKFDALAARPPARRTVFGAPEATCGS
jgi:pyruvate-formate lyase-activating enzyme